MNANLAAAILCGLLGAAGGRFVPALIGRLPEPEANPDEDPDLYPAKILYADLATRPGLAWKCALASGLVAGVFGLALGWVWPLIYLVALGPVGVALGYVDLRTWYLPTRIIAPTYAGLVALLLVVFAIERDPDDLVRAGLGWLIMGGFFWLAWRFLHATSYGDVRLSGVLGLALGFLGWGQLVVGAYAGFLLGLIGWVALRRRGETKTSHYPFGPFMLAGAVLGVVWGAGIWGHLVAARG